METLLPGFWYLEDKKFKNKLLRKKLKILSTKLYSFKNNNKNWRENENLYKKILPELVKNLNRIHKLNWKIISWEIIIGPWLKKYITVINNRIFIIKNNRKIKKKFLLRNNNKINNLNSYDINDFIHKAINDDWNEELFKRLENYFYLNQNLSKLDAIKIDNYSKPNKVKILFKTFVKFFLKFYNFIFSKYSSFVFSRPYFGKKIFFLKILLKLKEFPILYILDNDKLNLKFNQKLRNSLSFLKAPSQNEKISKLLIPECLPRIYLEGFHLVLKRIKESSLPKEKKVIFTSNLRNDSMFKFWLGFQKEKGGKIILAQHGGGYNMFNFDESLKYELKICDRYLSWGWKKKNNKKVISFSILNQNITNKQLRKNKKNFCITMNNHDQYAHTNEPSTILNLIKSEKNLNYRELNSLTIFLKGIKKDIKKRITIRPHPSKLRKHTTAKFEKDFEREFNFNRNYNISGEKFLEEFELNIVTQLQSSTTVFSLAKNYPTIIICPHDLRYFNHETRKKILLLKKAKIFHSSPIGAYKFFNKIYKDPKKWWFQKKTQQARSEFCNIHGKCSGNEFMNKFIKILINEKKL